MRFATVRSGLTETFHDVDVFAVDADGTELLASGDPDLPMFYRSAVKPFQTTAAIEAGLDLPPEHLAVTAASHGGWPAHLATVTAILRSAGLDEDALGTPPSWPLSTGARSYQQQRGARHPRPIFHNCSGKHAGMLAACIASGWPIDSYLDPGHPLQQRILSLVSDVTGVTPTPLGVDGCGAPTLKGSVRGLATAFSALTTDPRHARVKDAVSRFPSLVADNERPDGVLARWWGGPVKGGAAGAIGLGRHGVGIAAKARSGWSEAAIAAAIAAADQLGLISDAMREGLAAVAAPVQFGGGQVVGSLTPL